MSLIPFQMLRTNLAIFSMVLSHTVLSFFLIGNATNFKKAAKYQQLCRPKRRMCPVMMSRPSDHNDQLVREAGAESQAKAELKQNHASMKAGTPS
jgi:hypothetical protein